MSELAPERRAAIEGLIERSATAYRKWLAADPRKKLGDAGRMAFGAKAQSECLLERLKAAEQRIAELEAASTRTLADAFKGSWQSPLNYARGDLVVHAGSTWISLVDSRGVRPGDGVTWKLIVKSGR